MKLLRLISICALFLGSFVLLIGQNQLIVSLEQVLAIGVHGPKRFIVILHDD